MFQRKTKPVLSLSPSKFSPSPLSSLPTLSLGPDLEEPLGQTTLDDLSGEIVQDSEIDERITKGLVQCTFPGYLHRSLSVSFFTTP